MATLYEQKFRDVLEDMFQLNQAELDFGIYRIMNQKRQDIDRFLNFRLVPEVTRVLKENADHEADISAMENEVFSHLTKFFSRYYDGGDFISKRRYKDDTYAIPYSGEEVKLYWANADQYYIKTSEYFKNYAFILSESRLCSVMLKRSKTTTRRPTTWSAALRFVRPTLWRLKTVSFAFTSPMSLCPRPPSKMH